MSDKKFTLRIADTDYTFRMTLGSLRKIGDELGIKIRPGHVGEDLMEREMDLGVFGVVLWACLQHHAEPPTLAQVEGAVDQDNFAEVLDGFFGLFGATSAAQRMRAALTGATPNEEQETEEPLVV